MNESSSSVTTVETVPCIALIGSPNVGKTSLFNRLTNLLAKTSNFPGTTVEVRTASMRVASKDFRLVDLPGVYSLDATSPEEWVTRDFLQGSAKGHAMPDGVIVVVDATQLERTLFIVGQARALRLPMVVAVSMIDLAAKGGKIIDCKLLSRRLGLPVVPLSCRTGEGIEDLKTAIASFVEDDSVRNDTPLAVVDDESCDACGTCPYADGYRWSTILAGEISSTEAAPPTWFSQNADRIVTNRIFGPIAFAAIMLVLFSSIFWIAQWPMEWVDAGMGRLGEAVSRWVPAGDFNDLLTNGIIGGAGSVFVFLPQICVLFFLLSLLEDSGYLARAVVVVDRWMRRVGLPGQAFVPMLAAHACAIPSIMSTRVIENRRDRLTAILVIPLMTCSARLPVYAMVAAMLFPNNAFNAAVLFASAYGLGMTAAFSMAWLLRRSILPGEPSPLILQLPPYRRPSVRTALRHAWDRGLAFIRDAGPMILVISIGIWTLSTYPKISDSQMMDSVAAAQLANPSDVLAAESGPASENALRQQIAQEHSWLGRLGKTVQPIFEPLGFDWRTSVGVLASFAAREVVVSTLSVLYGAGEETDSLIERVSHAQRSDGSPAFDVPTSISLLVFFVLAMQCLPTQAVTRKETGSWKWPIFQWVYMTTLAYVAAYSARIACLALLT